MSDKQFFIIFMVSALLYFVSYKSGEYLRKRKEIKDKPVKDYLNKVILSINKMNGSEFEDFVSFVFKELGFKVKQTAKTRDGGKDLILKTTKGKVYVEVKRYSSKNPISSSLVLKLIGSAVSDGINECIFLTTSRYTKDALELVENSKVNVKLIDLDGFKDMIKKCNSGRVLGYLGY